MTPEEFLRRKKKVERLQEDAAKAEGALEQLKAELKEKLKCKSGKDAKRKIKRKQREADVAKQRADEAWQEFEQQMEAHKEDI